MQDAVAAGIDLVSFSGDKLLGAPQAGILVGRRDAIERIRQDPLMRALRCGKLTYAALEATLKLFLNRKDLDRAHPALRMLTQPVRTLRRRAGRLLKELGDLASLGIGLDLEDSVARSGSGALPLAEIPSTALVVSRPGGSIGQLAAKLRRFDRVVQELAQRGQRAATIRLNNSRHPRQVTVRLAEATGSSDRPHP